MSQARGGHPEELSVGTFDLGSGGSGSDVSSSVVRSMRSLTALRSRRMTNCSNTLFFCTLKTLQAETVAALRRRSSFYGRPMCNLPRERTPYSSNHKQKAWNNCDDSTTKSTLTR